jgi:hypothetical protein
MRGKVSALGTYHLAPPSTQQDFVFAGLQVMAQIALGGAVMFAIGVVRNLQDPATMAFNWRSDAR